MRERSAPQTCCSYCHSSGHTALRSCRAYKTWRERERKAKPSYTTEISRARRARMNRALGSRAPRQCDLQQSDAGRCKNFHAATKTWTSYESRIKYYNTSRDALLAGPFSEVQRMRYGREAAACEAHGIHMPSPREWQLHWWSDFARSSLRDARCWVPPSFRGNQLYTILRDPNHNLALSPWASDQREHAVSVNGAAQHTPVASDACYNTEHDVSEIA